MADFNPDAYLAAKAGASGAAFDPDSYLEQKAAPTSPAKDGDAAVTGGDPDKRLVGRIGNFVGGLIGGPAKALAGALTAPMAQLDKVSGAPPRAAVGALLSGGGISGAAQAFGDQMKAGLPSVDAAGIHAGTILPTTPTGQAIASKGMANFGIAKPFADSMAPVMGAGVDATLDLTQGLPGELLKSGLGMGARALGAGAVAAEDLGLKATASVGQKMTGGVMGADEALQAAKTLTARQMLMPGTKDFGALGRAMGDVESARAALQAPITVPGSGAIAQNVAQEIQASIGRTVSAPKAAALLDMIKARSVDQVPQTVSHTLMPWEADQLAKETEAQLDDIMEKISQIDNQRANHVVSTLTAAGQEVNADNIAAIVPSLNSHPGVVAMDRMRSNLDAEATRLQHQLVDLQGSKATGQPYTQQTTQMVPQPRDMTLNEIDDVVGALEQTGFKTNGDPKALGRVYGPTVQSAFQQLRGVMSTTPEGALFDKAENTAQALQTVAGPSASLTDQARALAKHSATIYGTLLSAMTSPTTYYKLMGAIKAPSDMVEAVGVAMSTGKLGMIQDAITQMAEKYPVASERFLRGMVLITGKPTTQQFLTPDEANTLGATRIFDAQQIAAEKQRINSDDSLDSVEKSQALSAINRNGYVTMEGPKAPPAPAPALEDEDKVASLKRSIRATTGR